VCPESASSGRQVSVEPRPAAMSSGMRCVFFHRVLRFINEGFPGKSNKNVHQVISQQLQEARSFPHSRQCNPPSFAMGFNSFMPQILIDRKWDFFF